MTHGHFAALARLACLGLLLSSAHLFCFSACPEIDDSHFQKIYESESARVFTLELGRLESTTSYCPQHAYFYVVTSETETTDTPAGRVGWSHRWNSGEARFVAEPKPHVIRNNMATTHRAVFVEILTKLEFNPLTKNYETDDFTGDLGSAKPTWTVSVEHGPMSAEKTQLGPADGLTISRRARVLIALNDISLHGSGRDIKLAREQVHVISPESDFTVTNVGPFPAKFITIAF